MNCRFLAAGLGVILLFASASPVRAQAELPDTRTLRGWIQEMKGAAKGPFSRIRWFCNDGTVLPPKAYACEPHGGGVQHGEWNERAKALRAAGYQIASFLADLDADEFKRQPAAADTFNQMLLEQFLVRIDDGWILRNARSYRGAFQIEDELAGARRLLTSLARDANWVTQKFVPLRIGARLLAHGQPSSSVSEVRQLSADLSAKDKDFSEHRNKIHGKLEPEDAARVRAYAATSGRESLAGEYERLAALIDAVYSARSLAPILEELAPRLAQTPKFSQRLSETASTLAVNDDPVVRFAATAQTMAELRDVLPDVATAELRLELIDLSLALEVEHFAASTRLREGLEGANRRARLVWLQASALGGYGTGFLTRRELEALRDAFATLNDDVIPLARYKAELDYLARVPGWASQRLRAHFLHTVHQWAAIEPRAELFIPDQLRGAPLLFYANVLDGLLQDANQLAGVRRQLFGSDVGGGLRSLNPGLARGTLRLATSGKPSAFFQTDGIYLLPETLAELPPVAGILTAGEGNPLSHVQLLARNLGIPNVGIDERLIAKLNGHDGQRVVLAVSPGGSVQLAEDDVRWDEVFDSGQVAAAGLIRPDLEKLDLQAREFIPLSRLRATDSGRTVGPKAAKLGELRHHYPEAVAEGLTIPFGFFRALLDRPMEGENQSAFDWMVARYRALENMQAGSLRRRDATEIFRKRLEDWILGVDLGADFRVQLEVAMAETFGEDGTYGVFVRSDTNVEDLPGFTGAGLNLTVPNVVGFAHVLQAIPRVWASPFSQRAFAWRQSQMDKPEHVYPAILLLRSVPAEKSGVMVTQDIDSGDPDWLSVAVNEGVGGAVDGQAAESLRIHMSDGRVRLLAEATAPLRRTLLAEGGLAKRPVSGSDVVLKPSEIEQLIALARGLPERFPRIQDADGNPAPADIEFGFLDGRLKLFQVRPFLESKRARSSLVLTEMDRSLRAPQSETVAMDAVPGEGR